MKSVKRIATFLDKIVKIVAIGYLITAIYTLTNCLFKGPFFETLEKNRFAINFPFTQVHFLLGSEYSFEYVYLHDNHPFFVQLCRFYFKHFNYKLLKDITNPFSNVKI